MIKGLCLATIWSEDLNNRIEGKLRGLTEKGVELIGPEGNYVQILQFVGAM